MKSSVSYLFLKKTVNNIVNKCTCIIIHLIWIFLCTIMFFINIFLGLEERIDTYKDKLDKVKEFLLHYKIV